MVVSNFFPYLEVAFEVRGFERKELAYLDTGFDGFLIIPSRLASSLGDPDFVSRWELGDNSLTYGADYLGEISIVGLSERIKGQVTCLGDEWMLGLGILNHFKIVFDHGRSIEVHEN